MPERHITRIVEGQYVSDGGGVRLRRIIGTPQLDALDPFLMLDEFRTESADDYVAGFPDHPHRGFETVTYMMQGAMRHQDSVGNSGVLRDGAVQWMTAGRGIVHSEMPEQVDGLLWGYQLWVNLPSRLKMSEPRYQDIPAADVAEAAREGTHVRVLAGAFDGTEAATDTLTPITFLDVRLEPGTRFAQPLSDGHNAFAYVYDGGISGIDPAGAPAEAEAGSLALLARQGDVAFAASANGAKFLLLAGAPIGEPVARMGPFVMNTKQELVQAVRDYEAGTLA